MQERKPKRQSSSERDMPVAVQTKKRQAAESRKRAAVKKWQARENQSAGGSSEQAEKERRCVAVRVAG